MAAGNRLRKKEIDLCQRTPDGATAAPRPRRHRLLKHAPTVVLTFQRSCKLQGWSSLLDLWRNDLGDPTQAVGFVIVWTRHECSADLRGIPTRHHTEAKRLFSLDVTRREILHQVLSVGPFDLGTSRIGRSLVQPEHRLVQVSSPGVG